MSPNSQPSPALQLTSAAVPGQDTIRLHISPFTPELLNSLLPPSILPLAQDLSYHTLETFPEKSYGYVTLPTAQGKKLRGRLNGLIIKGTKVRIESARPQRSLAISRTDEPTGRKLALRLQQAPIRRPNKRNCVPGIELPSGRRVQRGWAKPASTAKKSLLLGDTVSRARASSKPDCLFRMKLPSPSLSSGRLPHLREIVVRENSQVRKWPSFLRDDANPPKGSRVLQFIDQQGWFNEAGDLVEAHPALKSPNLS
ncbi:MAG: hypothetical protein M1829_000553 [Trizodia sp. TS-e1964]|nr:MAG: hypothetical protein M1829_000553 [Trizodia sp. TS-e1964]